MKKWLSILIVLFLTITSLNVVGEESQQQSNNNLFKDYKRIGSALMQVMYWKMYRAEFYVLTDVTQQTYKSDLFPQALKITYLRKIDNKDLVEATKIQWQHLKVDEAKQTKWLSQLSTIFPNIKEGDALTLIVDENKISTFYVNVNQSTNRKIGVVDDVEFGPAFLAIWLSEKTSKPKLRSKLLGLTE